MNEYAEYGYGRDYRDEIADEEDRLAAEQGKPWHRRKESPSGEKIQAWIERGYSVTQIAKYYNKSRATIYRRLKDAEEAQRLQEEREARAREEADMERERAAEAQERHREELQRAQEEYERRIAEERRLVAQRRQREAQEEAERRAAKRAQRGRLVRFFSMD